MYNFEQFGAQIERAREDLFGKNLDPEVRPGWGQLPSLNFDPNRIIKCELNGFGEPIPVANVVEVADEK